MQVQIYFLASAMQLFACPLLSNKTSAFTLHKLHKMNTNQFTYLAVCVCNMWIFYGPAEKKFGKRGNAVVMADGSKVEDLCALRENDKLFIF